MLNAVDLQAVGLQRASLCERFLAQIALVGTNAGVGSRVSLQVKGVVESFAAERAQVSLHVRVTFHVTVQQSLKCEVFRADAADELAVLVLGRGGGRRRRLFHGNMLILLADATGNILDSQRILDAVSAIDELQLHLSWKPQL